MPARAANRQLSAHKLAKEFFANDDASVLVGPGDDAAVLVVTQPNIVVTSDFRSERNFLFGFGCTDYEQAGRLSVRQNASDVLASGAWPKWFVLSVMFPKDVAHHDIEALFRGVRDECDRFDVSVVGGDTKQGGQFNICGTMIAETPGQGWQMSHAKPDMDLYATGELGGVTAALAALSDPNLARFHEEALSTLANSEIPVEALKRLIASGREFSANDISDGLGYSIRRLARLSNVNAAIDLSALPYSSFVRRVAEAVNLPPVAFPLGFGGDFQFLLAAGKDDAPLLESVGAHRIGVLFDPDDAVKARTFERQGVLVGEAIPEFGFLDFESISDIERFKDHAVRFR